MIRIKSVKQTEYRLYNDNCDGIINILIIELSVYQLKKP